MRATILVIDDDPLIRQVADLVLTQAGYTVASASSGESGLKVAEHTRRRAKIPVMMLTARSDLDTIKAALAAGADGYMVKPFKPADLLRRIDAVLKPAAEAPAPPPSSTSIVLD
jgi:DNA-binding response OmpR family regulator